MSAPDQGWFYQEVITQRSVDFVLVHELFANHHQCVRGLYFALNREYCLIVVVISKRQNSLKNQFIYLALGIPTLISIPQEPRHPKP